MVHEICTKTVIQLNDHQYDVDIHFLRELSLSGRQHMFEIVQLIENHFKKIWRSLTFLFVLDLSVCFDVFFFKFPSNRHLHANLLIFIAIDTSIVPKNFFNVKAFFENVESFRFQ